MSNFNISNNDFSGDNISIGDKYIDNSINFTKELTAFEKEIVGVILETGSSDGVKKKLIDCLKHIKEEDNSIIKSEKSNIWKRFLEKLYDSGLTKVADKIISYSITKLPELAFLLESVGKTGNG